jgi:hypothetical protein
LQYATVSVGKIASTQLPCTPHGLGLHELIALKESRRKTLIYGFQDMLCYKK